MRLSCRECKCGLDACLLLNAGNKGAQASEGRGGKMSYILEWVQFLIIFVKRMEHW